MAAPQIYTLSLHDALPISNDAPWRYTISWGDGASQSGSTSSQSDPITASHLYVLPATYRVRVTVTDKDGGVGRTGDRKSTRLNSSHQIISYAVFCLKKKKK